MTAPEQTVDVFRAFRDALTPAARHHLSHLGGQGHIALVTRACERHTPAELARIVSAGITRASPANAAGLIRYRLERAAGKHDDDNDRQEART